MAYIPLEGSFAFGDEKILDSQSANPRILIFTEGTIFGPKHWWEFFNDTGYIPIGKSVEKIQGWDRQGARISYLTSCRRPADAAMVRENLLTAHFPGDYLYYRGSQEQYRDIAEQLVPDILIEDDCRSIGGQWQMTITHVKQDVKQQICSVVVREFQGIDHLPADLQQLISWNHIARR